MFFKCLHGFFPDQVFFLHSHPFCIWLKHVTPFTPRMYKWDLFVHFFFFINFWYFSSCASFTTRLYFVRIVFISEVSEVTYSLVESSSPRAIVSSSLHLSSWPNELFPLPSSSLLSWRTSSGSGETMLEAMFWKKCFCQKQSNVCNVSSFCNEVLFFE